MGAVLARLRAYEPLRLFVYPVLAGLVGILVVRGYLAADLADVLVAAIALVIGVPATELARGRVWPQSKIADAVTAGTHTAISKVETAVGETFGPIGIQVLDQIRDQVGQHSVTGVYRGRHHSD
jgi:hypothetical protein